MCGISGKIHFDRSRPVEEALLQRMNAAVAHRGPDEEGSFRRGPVGLAHRRLSIIDLAGGQQPLSNETGDVWVVFNGEIYNYQALREELLGRGHTFETDSDTEVLVHLYEDEGDDFLGRLHGMFGFALFDERRNRLLVARDRVGIKPVYWTRTADGVLFASELKSLLADPTVGCEVDPRAIDRFLQFRFLPGEATLIRGIHKLLPGHRLTVEGDRVETRPYWDLAFDAGAEGADYGTAVDALETLLGEVVTDHMISDVPVGCLLSGGVDSSAVLSLAVEATEKPIQTFTIGFEGEAFADERPYARIAAEHFGTDHHETTLSARDFQDFLPRYVWHMEEPVCEPPAVALHYLSKLAREHVKVVLSGEGGDEAFAGYSTYRNLDWLTRLGNAAGPLRPLLPALFGLAGAAGPTRRLGAYAPLAGRDLGDYYHGRSCIPPGLIPEHRSEFYTSELLGAVDTAWSVAPTEALLARTTGQPAINRMLYVDTRTWLPDELLVKADKISMANSLELRVPLLDHRVLEFAARLPTDFKLRRGNTKRILRDAIAARVPREILARKKEGFPVPYDRWLREDSRDFVHDVLQSRAARERGYFRREAIERLLREQREGLHAKEVFSLVVLELWHRIFGDRSEDFRL